MKKVNKVQNVSFPLSSNLELVADFRFHSAFNSDVPCQVFISDGLNVWLRYVDDILDIHYMCLGCLADFPSRLDMLNRGIYIAHTLFDFDY